jgi:hypothetical protein
LGISTLKILRWGSEVYFLANNELLLKSKHFDSTTAKFRILANNLTTSYGVYKTVVEHYMLVPYVVFDDQVVSGVTVVSDYRLRGIAPPSIDEKEQSAAYKGLVDVHVVGISKETLLNSYEYYYVDALRILNSKSTDVVVSIINDSQINTPSEVNKGL